MMSTPENKEEKKDDEECNRKKWDECIKRATTRIAFGMIVGAIGSAFMGGSELPLRLCTGLTAGWSVNRCRRLFNPPPPPPPPPPPTKPEDPCACCFSDFEPLIRDEFEGTDPAHPPQSEDQSFSPQSSTSPSEEFQETKCTCGEEHLYEWSVPIPAQQEILDEIPQCTCDSN